MDANVSASPDTGGRQAVYADQPRLARWAHWATFAGLLLHGLSIVGIVLAWKAKAAGEFGAEKALRNAVAVTGFLILFYLVLIAISLIP